MVLSPPRCHLLNYIKKQLKITNMQATALVVREMLHDEKWEERATNGEVFPQTNSILRYTLDCEEV